MPHYARFAAILNKYMPDIGVGLIAILDEEFKYLQRKKLVAELERVRLKVRNATVSSDTQRMRG